MTDPKGPYGNRHRWLIKGAFGEPGVNEGTPIFPLTPSGKTGFTVESLRRLREDMQEYNFRCQMLNDPAPMSGYTFKRENIRLFTLVDGRPPTDQELWYYTSVDINHSFDHDKPFGVALTVGVSWNREMWVVDMDRGHPTFGTLAEWAVTQAKRWQCRSILFEAVGAQIHFGDNLREEMLKRQVIFPTEALRRGGVGKDERNFALADCVKNGSLHIREGLDVVVYELVNYGGCKFKDTVDALSDVYHHGACPPQPSERILVPKNRFVAAALLEEMLGQGRPRGAPVHLIR
jgi:hypothetical protein